MGPQKIPCGGMHPAAPIERTSRARCGPVMVAHRTRGVTGIPCDLPCSAHLSTRAEGHDVIFLGIFFDEDLEWFIGFKMRYYSTPTAGAFQFPPKSPRNDPSNVIFATFPTILAMFCMPARGPVGVRLGPKSGPAHPQGSPQGPQRVWGDSRKKSFFSIPGYPKPASRTEAIVLPPPSLRPLARLATVQRTAHLGSSARRGYSINRREHVLA